MHCYEAPISLHLMPHLTVGSLARCSLQQTRTSLALAQDDGGGRELKDVDLSNGLEPHGNINPAAL